MCTCWLNKSNGKIDEKMNKKNQMEINKNKMDNNLI